MLAEVGERQRPKLGAGLGVFLLVGILVLLLAVGMMASDVSHTGRVGVVRSALSAYAVRTPESGDALGPAWAVPHDAPWPLWFPTNLSFVSLP